MIENIPLVVNAVVFVSVVLFITAGWSVFRKGFKRYEEKYLTRTAQSLDEMFLVFTAEQILYLNLLSVFVFGALIFFISGSWQWMIFGALFGWLLPKMILRIIKKKRLKNFEEQLLTALSTLSSSLRAGFSLVQALEMISREMNPPISQEFGLMLRENKLGVHLDKALQNMTERVKSSNLDLMITSIIIARSSGGNLAEIFERISNTIREINRLEGKINALTAQGRLQGIIIGLLPIVLGYIIYLFDPEMMMLMFNDPIGWGILGIIVIFEALGVYFIWRIISIDI